MLKVDRLSLPVHHASRLPSAPWHAASFLRPQEEQVLTDRLIDLKQQGHAMRACEWYNARERGDVALKELYEKKKITNELEQANKELLLLRRARMKELLEAEAYECARSHRPCP